MRLHRFIIFDDFEKRFTGLPVIDEVLRTIDITDQRVVRQVHSVLRLKLGDEFILCDKEGREAHVRIAKISARTLHVRIDSIVQNQIKSDRACILYCAVLKKDSFEWVVQKCTEVGVSHIFPIITKRTVKLSVSLTRLEAIAIEAAEQSGRGFVPLIVEPQTFENAISEAKKKGTIIFCDPSGEVPITQARISKEKIVNIFIGPEGGWDPYELDRARISGAQIVSLGKTILRAETAAIVASYMAVNP